MRTVKSGGAASACDRLLHPSVVAEGRRGRQGRFLALMLAGPFLAAGAAAPILVLSLNMAAALALTGMLLCAGWLLALAVAATGRSRFAEHLALIAGAVGLAGLVAAAGGFASPLAALFVALPLETRWVGRTRAAGLAGLAAGGLSVLLSTVLGATFFDGGGQVASAWQWMLPLAYAATLWPRLGELSAAEAAAAPREGGETRLEDAMGAMVLRMTKGGDVTAASPQAEEMLGVASDMLLGGSFFERIHLADRVGYLSALADLRRGAGRRQVELRLRRATDGAAQTAGYRSVFAEIVADERSGGLLAMLSDDTRTTDLKAALARETERGQAAEIGRARMLGAVSHELRTPLNAILGFSDVLGKEMFGSLRNERQAEYVGLIHHAGEHLLSVVNALLDLSRIESGAVRIEAETFDFDEAVSLSMSMVERQAEEGGVRIECASADVGSVHCDRRILQQVLINLLSNAVKFTPAGGSAALSAHKRDGWLDFEISDTGIGMAHDDLERVGTPFLRIASEKAPPCEGAGLGLSLVKGLIDLQHGGMSIESAPGAGTRVRVSIPMAATDESVREGHEDGADTNEEDGKTNVLRKTG